MTTLAVSISSSLFAATVIQLDFTSDGSGDAGSFGGTNPPVGTAAGYTDFIAAELGPSANTTVNPFNYCRSNDLCYYREYFCMAGRCCG